jgi:hypothetical protein
MLHRYYYRILLLALTAIGLIFLESTSGVAEATGTEIIIAAIIAIALIVIAY